MNPASQVAAYENQPRLRANECEQLMTSAGLATAAKSLC